jgi:hypothetical protein
MGGQGDPITRTGSPNGRLFVPPAYYQVAGDQALQLDSANDWIATRIIAETDFQLQAISRYVTAVGSAGTGTLEVYSDSTAIEPNGDLNGSVTNSAPTMNANNAPSPNVVGLWDKNGNNAEAGAGYEAYKAMDGSTAADNGTRSNAAPTGSDPIIYTLDLGAGNSKAINKFRFVSWNNGDANVRAFPKAFTFWGSNAASPAPQTDGDWVQLTGSSSWTAETDPGAAYAREYRVNNANVYRHYRWKFTDRNGSNSYMGLGEIQIVEAAADVAPGASLKVLGALSSGSSADVWTRLSTADSNRYRLERGKTYWIVEKGEVGKDYSLSVRRWHTGQGSMFPDGCTSKYTTDGGITWSQCLQNNKPALWNMILNSQADHCPQLGYGRWNGQYIYIPGSGLISIPESGLFLDCSALSADTLYYVYAYVSLGALALEASTTVPVPSEGVEVKSGEATKLYLGMIYPRTIQAGKQGPTDVRDWRTCMNRFNKTRKPLGKLSPYSSYTTQVLKLYWMPAGTSSTDYAITFLADDDLVRLSPSFFTETGSGGRAMSIAIDGNILEESVGPATQAGYSLNVTNVEVKLSRGKHFAAPMEKANAGGHPHRYYYEAADGSHRANLHGEIWC